MKADPEPLPFIVGTCFHLGKWELFFDDPFLDVKNGLCVHINLGEEYTEIFPVRYLSWLSLFPLTMSQRPLLKLTCTAT